MAVDFLTSDQKIQYGQFSGEPNEVQLSRYFHLDEADIEFISNRRGDQNRLGFALQLTCARFLGSFLSNIMLVPMNVQIFVARQLSIQNISVLAAYAQRDTTKREHTALIRKQYGYREFNDPPWSFRLSRLLYTRSWISNERPSLMFDFATAWLIQNKVLLPGASTLSRLISEIRERANTRLWLRLSSLPSTEQKAKLETLLQVPEDMRSSLFDYYRKGPVSISSSAFNNSIDRYLELNKFDINTLDFTHIPPIRLKNLAQHAGVISMPKIARMADDKRIAILLAFVKSFEIIALDDALDVLDLLITKIISDAKNLGQKNRLRTLKDLDKSALALANICQLIVNDTTSNDQLREIIFNKTSKEELTELIIVVVNNLARPYDDKFHDEIVAQYGKVKRFLPRLLNNIDYKAAPAGENVFTALNYLISNNSSHKQIFTDPPLEIITLPWKRLVFDKDSQVTKKGYTLCFLEKLQDALRRRDIYVKNSDRWGDPREKLLQGEDWQANRIHVCRSLGHPVQPDEAIRKLTEQLDLTYKQVATNFDDNESIRIDHSGKHPSLTITHLDKLDEPSSLTLLNEQVTGLLPRVDLADLILEIHAHTGFSNEFTHVSESNARADDLTVNICAVLMAEACNIGLEPLIKHHVPALTRHRLSWVRQSYFRAETLIQANAKLVDPEFV